MKKLVMLVALSYPLLSAHALETPRAGRFDQRVKFVDYNPTDVVQLVAHFGYQIDIVLAEGEAVLPKGVYLGDGEAWQIATLGNHLFVKPKEENGRTNMTVLTNRRAYNFDLTSHWTKNAKRGSNDMYYQVNFRYPTDEAAKVLAARSKAAEDAAKKRLDERLAQSSPALNKNYFVQGSEELSPDAASDDGRFTRLTFRGNRDVPAIFVVNEDGSESLANRTVEGDTVVIHTVAKKFVLRKGNSVACVFNESFDPVGLSNSTGTTIPGVERVIKEER
jgi:type IV secretion system protein VirB9